MSEPRLESRLGDKSREIVNRVDGDLPQAILESLKQMHPRNRLKQIELDKPGVLLAIGKNAMKQAEVIEGRYGDLLEKIYIHQITGYSDLELEDPKVTSYHLPHPTPDETTFQTTHDTVSQLAGLESGTNLYILISGGGSAAFALPEEGISPDQYQEIIRLAIASGFSIEELNLIRSLIDQVKGGKLVNQLSHLTIEAWITSDVVGDDPRIVASGPTSSGIEIDPSVTNWLNRLFGSLKIDIDLQNLIEKLVRHSKSASNHVITTRMDLISALQSSLEQLGIEAVVADASLSGTVDEVASQMTGVLDQFSSLENRALIWSGEPTITLTSEAMESGSGGRISALCCLMAEEIKNYEKVIFVGLATDGQDGSSPTAGYVIDQSVDDHLRPLGGARKLIRNGNSGLALNSLGYSFDLSTTHINLLDIYIILLI